jgi:hypothetical protein
MYRCEDNCCINRILFSSFLHFSSHFSSPSPHSISALDSSSKASALRASRSHALPGISFSAAGKRTRIILAAVNNGQKNGAKSTHFIIVVALKVSGGVRKSNHLEISAFPCQASCVGPSDSIGRKEKKEKLLISLAVKREGGDLTESSPVYCTFR